MSIPVDEIREHLRHVHLFRDLEDEDIDYIVDLFEAVEYESEQVIFNQGDPPEWFGIVYSGAVEVSAFIDADSQEPTVLAILNQDDYFGEQAILNQTVRNATIRAVQRTIITKIDAEEFQRLFVDYPDVLKAIKLADRTRKLIRQRRFTKWLAPDEYVFLIALTHWGWLIRRLFLPLALAVPLLIGVYVLFTINLFWLPVAAIGGGFLGVWIGLVLLDWHDDSYVVTSKRVISDERLALLYTERAEAPLHAVRAVQVSQDPLEKALGYGDVVIQTFTGTITFPDVPDPYSIVNLISEHMERAQHFRQKEEEDALQRDIRISIGWEEQEEGKGLGRQRSGRPKEHTNTLLAFLRHFRPQFWERDGDTITLRKHPFILLKHMGLGLLGLFILSLLLVFRLYPIFDFMRVLEIVPIVGFAAAVLFVGLILFSWTLYQFEDWRNDVYQITPNLLVDSEQKPLLGNVDQRSASIDSVLNVSFSRPGILANLFNYGTVIIQTGGDTGELTFDWVVNPLTVQQEIFQRMETRRRKKEDDAASNRRGEIVEWLRAYAAVTQPENPADVE